MRTSWGIFFFLVFVLFLFAAQMLYKWFDKCTNSLTNAAQMLHKCFDKCFVKQMLTVVQPLFGCRCQRCSVPGSIRPRGRGWPRGLASVSRPHTSHGGGIAIGSGSGMSNGSGIGSGIGIGIGIGSDIGSGIGIGDDNPLRRRSMSGPIPAPRKGLPRSFART